MSTSVLFIASLDSRERYRFVMEPMLTTSMDIDCYKDSGNILVSMFTGVAFLLKRRRFDVVVLTGGDIRNLVWFSLVRLITNARIIIRFGGDPSSVRRSMQASVKASGNRLLYYRGALGFWATCFMLKRVEGVIAVSRHLVENIRPLAGGMTRFCVSPPIVQCNVVKGGQPDNDVSQFRLCTVTNLNYREKAEGVIFTIKALIECCQNLERSRNIIFEVVGGGRHLDSLTREIENTSVPENLTILIHGFQKDVAEFYARADVFSYNSTLDSYPLVLVEATAYGLPIVLNDWGPFSELYENEVSALIYETGNIGSLVGALLRLMDDPALVKVLGEGSRQQYQRNTIEARGVELASFVRKIA
ncbi:MAG: glycosyltransferase family 4 protein [Gammaproteobacteria bacterium]|nr:glycosyltransferase family 4 protein [Gammaproteobacteria bacterium]